MSLPFRDRHDAGRQLGELLLDVVECDVVVLGIPRGGVPVAYEVAHLLRAPLDTFMLRHLRAPGARDDDEPFGLVASGGVRLIDDVRVSELHVPPVVVEEVSDRERLALLARERTYRGRSSVLELRARTAILVDDGTAPLTVLRETAAAIREHHPSRLVLAVPLLSAELLPLLADCADDIITIVSPPPPVQPARWYHDLVPISHTEVRALLALAEAEAQSRELARA